MLLEQVLKNTSPKHRGFEEMQSAVKSIKDVAEYLNDQVNQRQKFNRMMAIEPRIRGVRDLIQPDRKLIK